MFFINYFLYIFTTSFQSKNDINRVSHLNVSPQLKVLINSASLKHFVTQQVEKLNINTLSLHLPKTAIPSPVFPFEKSCTRHQKSESLLPTC
jgi:hypothetical protein